MYSMRCLILWAMAATLLTSSLLAVRNGLASPGVLRVPQDYPSVQAAVNAANPGDTIIISPGTYYASITIDKDNLTVTGVDKELSVLYGDPGQPVAVIRANNVVVANLTMKFGHDGIQLVRCNNCTLKNNLLLNIYYFSIALTSSAYNTIVCNNITREGIINTLGGIRLDGSSSNVIQNNSITEVSETYAIGLFSSNNNALLDNNMVNDTEGIYLSYSQGNIIEGNNATSSKWQGMRLESSNSNTIGYNCAAQGWAAIRLTNSAQNTIYNNDFADNTVTADLFEAYDNSWDGGYPRGGNYWGIKSGHDSRMGSYQNVTGSDGISDEPYVLDGQNTDHYPLMGLQQRFSLGEWNHTIYFAYTTSNYTISNLSLGAKSRSIQFETDTVYNTTGFYRIAIPKSIIYASTTEWKALVNDEIVNTTVIEDEASTYLFFTSSYNAQTVRILGTQTTVLPRIHEITIAGANVNATSLYSGDKLNITVTIENLGETDETFNVIAYLNGSQTSMVTLSQMPPKTNSTQTFILNSINMPMYVECQVKVEAGPVPEETSTDDNVFIETSIVKIPGDVNGDKAVNILDITLVAVSFGATPGTPKWNPIADINKDGAINILDITQVAKEFNKTYP